MMRSPGERKTANEAAWAVYLFEESCTNLKCQRDDDTAEELTCEEHR
jgi:hypothetical protein